MLAGLFFITTSAARDREAGDARQQQTLMALGGIIGVWAWNGLVSILVRILSGVEIGQHHIHHSARIMAGREDSW